MISVLETSAFLAQCKGHPLVDVRSEGEYLHAHIPDAINLPLFNNEERKTVGTLYKQQGREAAMMKGLEHAAPKLAGFIHFIKPLVQHNKVFVHCWRGGMRSSSMAWLFNLFGYDVYVLHGGYKAYRHAVLQSFLQPLNMHIVGGLTGSGKTAVLQQLKNLGQQVIDLETIAHHRGSAFGNIGQPPQPSTEMFENLLHSELQKLNPSLPVWLEDESRSIGTVYLPGCLWNQMQKAHLHLIELPISERVNNLLIEYGSASVPELIKAFEKIERRLGNERYKQAVALIEAGNLKSAAEIALQYYDKAYTYCLSRKQNESVTHTRCSRFDIEQIAGQLISALPHADSAATHQ